MSKPKATLCTVAVILTFLGILMAGWMCETVGMILIAFVMMIVALIGLTLIGVVPIAVILTRWLYLAFRQGTIAVEDEWMDSTLK